MKRTERIFSFAVVAAVWASQIFILSGCSAAMQSAASANDGMYGAHDRIEIANRQRVAAELRRAEAEARRSELEAFIAESQVRALENGYYDSSSGNSYTSVLADTYESAYMRRLKGFNSPSYRMPSSYYNLRYGGAFNYVTAYDPAFYNIMVSGDQVWVEPKYISSMFGTWGATNVTFGVSYYPYSWYYGWNRPYYGAWWGYPRYSWYDWNWGVCYNPYRWWGYGYPYGYPYGWNYGWGAVGGPRPPHVNPPRPPLTGNGRPQRENVVNGPGQNRYQSPSTGKGYGSGGGGYSSPSRGTANGSGVYRPGNQTGGSRTGNNSGTVRNQGGSGNSGGSYNSNRGGSSFNSNGSGNRQPSSPSRGTFNGGSSGYSGGSSGGGSGSGRGNSIGR